MRPIVHKPGYVILGHFGELFLEDTFQTSQNDEAVARIIIVDDSEFDFSIALFDNGWLEGADHQLYKQLEAGSTQICQPSLGKAQR